MQQHSKCTHKHLQDQFQTLITKVLAISQFRHRRLQINQSFPQTFYSFHSAIFMLCKHAINTSCNQQTLSPIACQHHVSSSIMPKQHRLVSSANTNNTSIPSLHKSKHSPTSKQKYLKKKIFAIQFDPTHSKAYFMQISKTQKITILRINKYFKNTMLNSKNSQQDLTNGTLMSVYC